MSSYSLFLPSYSIGDEVYKKIPKICESYGRKAVVIGGKTAIAKAKKELLDGLKGSNIEILDFVWFGGDSSYENVDMLKKNSIVRNADMVFAVGGGRSIDTSKTMCDQTGQVLFVFPTIASNCAAITQTTVIYDSNHVFKELYFTKKSATHCFINTKIIAEAPSDFIWAGIGDALSKEYECTLSSRGDELDHTNLLGVDISRNCVEPLLKYGKRAYEDVKINKVSNEVEQVILNIIITTGLVSVLVKNDYNSCLAHSVYYGCTTLQNIEKNHLHGEIVSYGVLVMLTCDKQFKERNRVYKFNKSIGLPTCLDDIEVKEKDLDKVLDKIMETGDIKHVPYEITRKMIYYAIMDLEKAIV
ncbi:iron-containing alcohol dehydrogenase family protein [Clostridium botulinum]|uniref:Glycerol dehydrogenase n=1 Tax=Clostridium botulinum TaxID=1491 RepID=A0A6B4JKK4_CLOBO|nr:iron-containing alcohol dehydrogenase family protein [Clostridium botulinum]EES49463.1 glycerol dehydrogenase [Clostridium botulinum E1 str. 'BoNT E Beluga']MBY6760870.1 iron-containing alcohol dehydrogenase family protein [Clostridium botulinum]MBY6919838.1 iron-containing alcohol dehydrogenase family protein [Clostridium botulinum]MCR1130657.1 iron-containing alcohol dehydrogenase family protein [Clostridium botulinum]NFG59815.1 iron-containing alcohol dehydrogenase family protein [Clostr